MISLAETAILLAAAVVAVSLFRFARLSSILGYLAAGLAIGPWGLNLIGDIGRIMQVSEFGIVLLLFIIGLELQPTRLWVMRGVVFGLGAAQVALCAVLLGAGAWALGEPPVAAAVIGFGLSLSSTPLVLQVLAERGQLKTQYGRAAFGVLLFQDLAVLPALALLPLLAPLPGTQRSEEHTSELQSPCNLVCRLLLEKKKNKEVIALAHGKSRDNSSRINTAFQNSQKTPNNHNPYIKHTITKNSTALVDRYATEYNTR